MYKINKTAVVFLANNPSQGTLDFAMELSQTTDFHVFIVIDNNEKYYGKSFRDVNIIQVPDALCVANGYYNSNISDSATHIKKNPIALDKFLYSFCTIYTTYDFVWVFEDDVFIPSIDTIVNLDERYNEYDLITPNNFAKTDSVLDWHWKHVINEHNSPYFYSMICGMGLSRTMLNAVKRYVGWHKSLFYCEVMFNTLAHHTQLKVKDAFELKSIVWMGKWDIDEFLLLPHNVFHPRKDIDNHDNLRRQIEEAKKAGYTPKNILPDFVKKAN
jgi:hypothetical protein